MIAKVLGLSQQAVSGIIKRGRKSVVVVTDPYFLLHKIHSTKSAID
jgi:predicted transcriptional regulator